MLCAAMVDYKVSVYNAARDNNLAALKRYLHGRPQAEVEMLVSAKTNGATPLVVAARNGHYDSVYYLLNKTHADCEQSGSVTIDGETIEGAPPLWCAAAAGHYSIAKMLVKHGANVNSTTRTNSTPLRAACFDGHFEIVKFLIKNGADIEVANRHGHTCLMIACYKGHLRIAHHLLWLNADVNRRSVKGNTAMHDCAESGSLEILKLLLAHGATMDVDYYGMTPLLAASVTGHSAIVEHLIGLVSVRREDRIAALELLGSTYVDKKRDMVSALGLWRRAMEMRYDAELPVLPKPSGVVPVPAYDSAIEVTAVAALDDLVLDPDAMRMQALVIRERILGPAHPDTSYYIRYRGAVYADAGRFDRCIELWTYALTMQQSILEPLSPMTQSSLLSFAELFSFMLGEAGKPITRGRVVPPVDTGDMLMVFGKAVQEVKLGQKMQEHLPEAQRDGKAVSRALVGALHIACLLAKVLEEDDGEQAATTTAHAKGDNEVVELLLQVADVVPDTREEDTEHRGEGAKSVNAKAAKRMADREEVLKALYDLTRLKVTLKSGRTALHLVCYREAALVGRYPACQFPSPELARALLTVGADPNARDEAGNTPLHLAALARPCPAELAQALLEHGAHLDTKNLDGDTFETLLQDQQLHDLVKPMRYLRLSCLAARVVQRTGLDYRSHVPVCLHDVLETH